MYSTNQEMPCVGHHFSLLYVVSKENGYRSVSDELPSIVQNTTNTLRGGFSCSESYTLDSGVIPLTLQSRKTPG